MRTGIKAYRKYYTISIMSLADIVDNTITDKNTLHSYLDTYTMLFSSKKETAKNVLEIGIQRGGSIKLWRDYFTNAIVYGIDVEKLEPQVPSCLQTDSSVVLYTEVDAYNTIWVKEKFIDTGLKFDILIDDGPHSYISMVRFIELYLPILEQNGILVIEDIPELQWTEGLRNVVPEQYRKYVHIYDLRGNKGRYDDIMFVINKSAY